jgi:hypothetical protein
MRAVAALLFASVVFSNCVGATGESPIDLQRELRAIRGDPSLVVDMNRPLIVHELVSKWDADFRAASMSPEAATQWLSSLSAPQLYKAALAPSFAQLMSSAEHATNSAKPTSATKAVGDAGRDVSYTPVTPCRLIDTRGGVAAVYAAAGPFAPNEIRSYAVQGGNGVCLSQLPVGLNPAAIQIQVFGMPTTTASGDIEILPQGSAFGSTATMVYIGSIPFNTVSTNAKVNLASNQISVQVRGGGANIAVDVVGYFKAPILLPVNNSLHSESFTIFAGQVGSYGTLGCPIGQVTISGGCGSTSYSNLLAGSYLNVSNGWTCDYNNLSGLNQLVTVSAQCIEVPAKAF